MNVNEGIQVKMRIESLFGMFTRPDQRVERVSYPVMTPSAARGALSRIVWKPQMDWVVTRIDVLREPRFHNIGTSEVKSKASYKGIDVVSSRTRRNNRVLLKPAYVITAYPRIREEFQGEVHPRKYTEIFNRRLEREAFFSPPCMGSTDYLAQVEMPSPEEHPIDLNKDCGRVFFDYVYGPKGPEDAIFFHCEIKNGSVEIPVDLWEDVFTRQENLRRAA